MWFHFCLYYHHLILYFSLEVARNPSPLQCV